MKQEEFKKIPGVDKLLTDESIQTMIEIYGLDLVTLSIRQELEEVRKRIVDGGNALPVREMIAHIETRCKAIARPSLIPVINATGVVIHTNLGRSPLGDYVLGELTPVIRGYSNLEYDLDAGKRGKRESHISHLIRWVTGAEDAVVVNNNAAGVMLGLKTFAEGFEVIVSRGELIEIGGSFRLPEIMAASGAKMVEVGTTNRTRVEDYENAITDKTRIILKAHRSNYFISGFTEEPEIAGMVELAHRHNLIFMYDLGSGLLRKPKGLPLESEPDVRTMIESGVDIVCFSGDKLLGGPQAGIITGKTKYIRPIAKAPMMRALRTGKLTLSALSAVIRCYIDDDSLKSRLPLFRMLDQSFDDLKLKAEELVEALKREDIKATVEESKAYCGGGTLPHLSIPSLAVQIIPPKPDKTWAERAWKRLMQTEKPVVGVLREGKLMFDVYTIQPDQMPIIARWIADLKN